ncbi:MAG: ribosome recycling factor [Alphaproteobacteria bacterium]|nr:ribosome recycling factor [Alphaproteobacteria bacterium]
MSDSDLADVKRRMQSAVDVLRHELTGLRTGRASANLLEPITVEVYGTHMPLKQVATINVPEPRMITVQVWDRSQVKAVERAIQQASLGLNPIAEGQMLRIPIPELNQERRTELAKIAHKYAEQARIAVRNVRRDGMDRVKKQEKGGDLSQDEARSQTEHIQKVTDQMIGQIDQLLASKEKEIMQV